jgi:cytochrome P450
LAKNARRVLTAMDPPEHTQARRSVVGEFTVRRMNALKPRIQQIVDEHIDAMLAGPQPADLVKDLALPVPSLVICEQLGVPYEDHDFFQDRSRKLLHHELAADERLRAADEFRAYLDELVRKKEEDPTDDLIGRQVLKQRETGQGDHEDIVSIALILLLAGHETTANQISLGTLAILRHPDLREQLASAPEAIPDAVEELLRCLSITDFITSRVTKEDVELGGVVIPAGEGVTALAGSANHDPEVFACPEKLDLTRGSRHHVAFGYGAHQCIGQNLARLELQITYETLFRRLPGLRLAVPYEELTYRDDSAIYGLHELPVTW